MAEHPRSARQLYDDERGGGASLEGVFAITLVLGVVGVAHFIGGMTTARLAGATPDVAAASAGIGSRRGDTPGDDVPSPVALEDSADTRADVDSSDSNDTPEEGWWRQSDDDPCPEMVALGMRFQNKWTCFIDEWWRNEESQFVGDIFGTTDEAAFTLLGTYLQPQALLDLGGEYIPWALERAPGLAMIAARWLADGAVDVGKDFVSTWSHNLGRPVGEWRTSKVEQFGVAAWDMMVVQTLVSARDLAVGTWDAGSKARLAFDADNMRALARHTKHIAASVPEMVLTGADVGDLAAIAALSGRQILRKGLREAPEAIAEAAVKNADHIPIRKVVATADDVIEAGANVRSVPWVVDEVLPEKVTALQPRIAKLAPRAEGTALPVAVNETPRATRPNLRLVDDLARNSDGVPDGMCFTAGTEVHTPRGLVPIETIELGDRVATIRGANTAETAVDATWRRIELEMEDPRSASGQLQIAMLRPAAWVDASSAKVGAIIELAYPEMQVHGDARVTSIGDVVHVEPGRGRVVLSTIESESAAVLVLKFDGTDETLEPTFGHPLYSLDRNDWIEAGKLRVGERLRSVRGPLVIAAIEQKPGTHTVYNFEVETEHEYLTSKLGVQSHNPHSCQGQPPERISDPTFARERASSWMTEQYDFWADDMARGWDPANAAIYRRANAYMNAPRTVATVTLMSPGNEATVRALFVDRVASLAKAARIGPGDVLLDEPHVIPLATLDDVFNRAEATVAARRILGDDGPEIDLFGPYVSRRAELAQREQLRLGSRATFMAMAQPVSDVSAEAFERALRYLDSPPSVVRLTLLPAAEDKAARQAFANEVRVLVATGQARSADDANLLFHTAMERAIAVGRGAPAKDVSPPLTFAVRVLPWSPERTAAMAVRGNHVNGAASALVGPAPSLPKRVVRASVGLAADWVERVPLGADVATTLRRSADIDTSARVRRIRRELDEIARRPGADVGPTSRDALVDAAVRRMEDLRATDPRYAAAYRNGYMYGAHRGLDILETAEDALAAATPLGQRLTDELHVLARVADAADARSSINAAQGSVGNIVRRLHALDAEDPAKARLYHKAYLENVHRGPAQAREAAERAVTLQGMCFTAGTEVHTPRGLVAIETVSLGDRVLTTHGMVEGETEVDATWRRIELEMEDPRSADGMLHISLLRPREWVDQTQASVGRTLGVSLPEIDVRGEARVLAIAEARNVERGAGRVVVSTVRSRSAAVLVLKLRSAGQYETLEPTAGHRLYSLERNDWVEAGKLRVGERLRAVYGDAVIASITRKPGTHTVYNFEVETEHEYLVGKVGVQSHNQNLCNDQGILNGVSAAARVSEWRVKRNDIMYGLQPEDADALRYALAGYDRARQWVLLENDVPETLLRRLRGNGRLFTQQITEAKEALDAMLAPGNDLVPAQRGRLRSLRQLLDDEVFLETAKDLTDVERDALLKELRKGVSLPVALSKLPADAQAAYRESSEFWEVRFSRAKVQETLRTTARDVRNDAMAVADPRTREKMRDAARLIGDDGEPGLDGIFADDVARSVHLISRARADLLEVLPPLKPSQATLDALANVYRANARHGADKAMRRAVDTLENGRTLLPWLYHGSTDRLTRWMEVDAPYTAGLVRTAAARTERMFDPIVERWERIEPHVTAYRMRIVALSRRAFARVVDGWHWLSGSRRDGLCFAAGTEVHTPSGLVTIERIELGDRVLTMNGAVEGSTAVAETWRVIDVEMDDPRSANGKLHIELLRPPTWVDEVQAAVGALIPLELEEMGVRGEARVIAIRGPPRIEPGVGRIVLSTIKSQSEAVLVLRFRGTNEMLEPTASHPLYSLDRDGWVRAGKLRVGERLRTWNGEAVVASIERRPGIHTVYNFEVEAEHEYLVGKLGVQSHNDCPLPTGAGDDTTAALSQAVRSQWPVLRPEANEVAGSYATNAVLLRQQDGIRMLAEWPEGRVFLEEHAARVAAHLHDPSAMMEVDAQFLRKQGERLAQLEGGAPGRVDLDDEDLRLWMNAMLSHSAETRIDKQAMDRLLQDPSGISFRKKIEALVNERRILARSISNGAPDSALSLLERTRGFGGADFDLDISVGGDGHALMPLLESHMIVRRLSEPVVPTHAIREAAFDGNIVGWIAPSHADPAVTAAIEQEVRETLADFATRHGQVRGNVDERNWLYVMDDWMGKLVVDARGGYDLDARWVLSRGGRGVSQLEQFDPARHAHLDRTWDVPPDEGVVLENLRFNDEQSIRAFLRVMVH